MPKTSASTALTAPAVDSKLLDGAVDFSRPALDRMLTDCRAGKIDLGISATHKLRMPIADQGASALQGYA